MASDKIKTSNILLDMLIKQNGKVLSGEKAASELGISRVSVWKAIQKLKEDGYDIMGGRNKGYILNSPVDILQASEIEKNLSAFAKSICSGKIEIYKTIDSTNTEAKRRLTAFNAEALHGTVLFAEHQSKGRGRFSRNFYSPKGAGLYFSLIFCPSVPVKAGNNSEFSKILKAFKAPDSAFYTAISAVIICRCLKKLGFDVKIKWVNDIYLSGKKICGILSEGIIDMESSSVQAVIIGIGLNIKDGNFPEKLKNKAGFLLSEKNLSIPAKKDSLQLANNDDLHSSAKAVFKYGDDISVNRNILASSIVSGLIEAFYGFSSQTDLMKEYKNYSLLIGKKIKVLPFMGSPYNASVLDINNLGHLIIENEAGKKEELHSGEVSLEC